MYHRTILLVMRQLSESELEPKSRTLSSGIFRATVPNILLYTDNKVKVIAKFVLSTDVRCKQKHTQMILKWLIFAVLYDQSDSYTA